jgi:hypothetical protein
MANPTLIQILNRTRVHLNDVGRKKFTNEVLLPHLWTAIEELDQVLAENDIDVTEEVSVNLDVPANTKRIAFTGTTPTLPVDLISVFMVEEKPDGASDSQFREMKHPPRLSVREPLPTLEEWVWKEQELKFVGASQAVDIRLTYVKGMPLPAATGTVTTALETTEIPFARGLPFLSYKTAALASLIIDKNVTRAEVLHESAEVAFHRAINEAVKNQQDNPIRRRAYSRRAGRGRRLTVVR